MLFHKTIYKFDLVYRHFLQRQTEVSSDSRFKNLKICQRLIIDFTNTLLKSNPKQYDRDRYNRVFHLYNRRFA